MIGKVDGMDGTRRRVRVYVAGPYTQGDPVINTHAACQDAIDLMEAGFAVFCPHLSHFLHFLRPQAYDFWIEQDLEWLGACDCILRRPGPSSGADGEVERALEIEMPIFGSVAEVIEAYGGAHPCAERWIDG